MLDENKIISPRMRRPEPKQSHRNSAQIEFCFPIEEDVGRAGLDVLQERFQIRSPSTEIADELRLFSIDFFLLDFGTNHNGIGWERLYAGHMLRMEMRGREIQIGVLVDFGELAQNGLTISRPHSRVHDQRRSIPDDDADVGHKVYAPVRDHVDMLRHFDRFIFLHQGRRLRLIVTERRRFLLVVGNRSGWRTQGSQECQDEECRPSTRIRV